MRGRASFVVLFGLGCRPQPVPVAPENSFATQRPIERAQGQGDADRGPGAGPAASAEPSPTRAPVTICPPTRPGPDPTKETFVALLDIYAGDALKRCVEVRGPPVGAISLRVTIAAGTSVLEAKAARETNDATVTCCAAALDGLDIQVQFRERLFAGVAVNADGTIRGAVSSNWMRR